MKNIKIIFILLFIFSCNNKKDEFITPQKTPPVTELYSNAIKAYEIGKWNDAIDFFKKVEAKYSFTEYAPKSTLMLMFIYFETNDEIRAISYSNKFKKYYPSHKNMDYVDYIVALIFYERINVPSKDQTNTEKAKEQFEKLIKKYPKSKYAEDAKYKIDLINEQLAGKEMYLARYYIKKSKWIPAISKLNIVINKYGQTIYTIEALHRLVEIYYYLGNLEEAKKYASILGYNFNDSDWYKKSYKIINKDYNSKKIINKKKKKSLNFFLNTSE